MTDRVPFLSPYFFVSLYLDWLSKIYPPILFTVVENEEEKKEETTTTATPVKRGLFARFSSNKSNATIKSPTTPPNSPVPSSTPTTEATTPQGKQKMFVNAWPSDYEYAYT